MHKESAIGFGITVLVIGWKSSKSFKQHKPVSAKRNGSNKAIRNQSFCKARENARAQAAIGLRFTRHWFIRWHEMSQPITMPCTAMTKLLRFAADQTDAQSYFS